MSVPYKDLARELGKLMRKVRVEGWRRGRRVTATMYIAPATNVVAMEATRRA
jgi:hypothetical protein